ncbi:MAG: amidohydrolase [Spirosomataceae bacterium]
MKKLLFVAVVLISIQTTFAQKTAYLNGKVYTVNPKQPFAQAVLCQNGRILHVGTTAEIRKRVDADTKVIDLNGKLMLPGFIDNHTHFADGGSYLLGVDLRGAKSTAEFKAILKKYVAEHKGEWVKSGNWDHESWEVKELPTKEMLDDFSADTPIFVDRFDGHMGVANSYALKLAGITKDTPIPPGGDIVKDPRTGEPTGVLKDAAMSLIYNIIPLPTAEQKRRYVERALQEARENGITSVQDITFRPDLIAFQALEKENKLTCRVYTRLPISEYQNLTNAGIEVGFGSEKIRLGSLKAYADGSLGSSTALMFKPYQQNPNTRGLPSDILINGNLRKWALDADKNHLQLSVHAIGDSANYMTLKIFEECVNQNPAWDRRFRIEHAQHVRFEDIPLFAKLGVVASVQPYHCIDDGVWAAKRIGDRIAYTHPYASFLKAGVKLCMGSDWSVAPLNAIYGIYAAVTRRTVDGSHPFGWIPEQKIPVVEAIRGYTINNAYAAFEEHEKGSIEVGKLADMVVLDQDILTIDPIKIKDVKVLMTIFDGKVIYQRPNP